MREKTIGTVAASSPTWETLEAFARENMQQFLQRLLEEEVDRVLGRVRYARREPVEAAPGYRNGFGKPRRLSVSNGITLRRPRVRGLEARFKSRLLPAFKRRTEEVGRLLPELCLHGPAQATSIWPCAGCSGRVPRSRRRRSPGSRPAGRRSTSCGRPGPSPTLRSSTSGWMACT